jgi:4'-phosphopantetheinyl transferase EntD
MGSEDHLPDGVWLGKERLLTPGTIAGAEVGPATQLFGGYCRDVIVEETTLPAEPLAIDREEAEHVAGAVLRRRVEYSAGRWCARRALTRLGLRRFVLRSGTDRAPQWPAAVVGSITHTGAAPGGYCAVAVAPASAVRTLGIDAEDESPLDPSLWPSVLTRGERDSLGDQPENDVPILSKVLFSAKECFYKAQYPLSREYLDFQDVEVALDPGRGGFLARVVTDTHQHLPLHAGYGRFLVTGGLIVTAMVVPG